MVTAPSLPVPFFSDEAARRLRPLRHGVFARYMGGEFISMIGTWMQLSAQGWVITNLTEKASVLGWLNFTASLPILLLTLVGGRLADRRDKRTILLAALAVQLAGALVVGWLVGHQQIAIWHIFVVAAIVSVATAFEVPAVSAFVPELVPREEMTGAIAIDRSSFHATRLIGPSLGGYLVYKLGMSSAYYCNAVSYLALGAALLTIPPRRVSQEPVTAESQGIREGLAYVRRDEPTRIMMGMMASLTMFISPFIILTMPFYARFVLDLDSRGMGYLMAVSGIGSLSGSLILLSIPHGRRTLALKLAAGAIVVAICGMASAHSFWMAAVFLILLTIGVSSTFGIANILIQERAPDEMRGRVSSVSSLSYFGVVTLSGILITNAINVFGMRTTLVGGAVGYALAAAFLLGGRERLGSAPAKREKTAELV